MQEFTRDQSILYFKYLRENSSKELDNHLYQFEVPWSGKTSNPFSITRNEIKKVITTACSGILSNALCFGFKNKEEETRDTQQFVAAVTSDLHDEKLLSSYACMLRMLYFRIPINTSREIPRFIVVFYDFEVPKELIRRKKFLNYILSRCYDRLLIEKVSLDHLK